MANNAVGQGPLVGRTLSHYRIADNIGEGGMGEVYRARDERLDRDVAIKLLPVGALANESARKHLRKEALALSRLNHPNIETIFDFDSDNGLDFIVTEYIPGETLNQKLASGALPEKEIVRLGSQLADGLAAAHEQGIIHRDLKPSNLRITPDGRLKILDFGIAKLTMPASFDAATASLSESMRFAGTLPYMAPEQVRGGKLDTRTDIWAAGAVLYEMAAGHRPFRAPGLQVTDQILHQEPAAPSSVNRRISTALESAVLKCLDKDPDNRYQSVKELAVDLRRLQTGMATGPLPAARVAKWPSAKLVGLGLGILASVTVLLIAFNVASWRDRLFGQTGAPSIESVAVLPLANLSGDPQQEYFADGMTEELIASLGKISALRVISRTSVMQYKQTKKTLPTIGHELNVDAVVEGSVLLSGSRVRITVQLIQAKAERHLWAGGYERDLSDILTLQSEVARTIASEIKAKVTPQEQTSLASARAVNPEAYEAYLQGRYYWNKRSREGVLRGLEYFQKAGRLDPTYALAYVGVADSYVILLVFHWLPPAEAIPRARRAALKALSIDETLAEAHTSLAYITISDWDWATAEREFRRALGLNPNYATAHLWYSVLLSETGRHEEAMVEARRAAEIDPLALIINTNVGQTLYLARRYDEALRSLLKVIEIDPNFGPAQYCAGEAYVQTGRFNEGIAALKQAAILSSRDDMVFSALVYAYGRAGRKAEAQNVLDEWKNLSRERYVSAYLLAESYVGLGEKEKAMQSLEKAYQERDTLLGFIGTDPMLDPLRSDPRFQDLLRRMYLPQSVHPS